MNCITLKYYFSKYSPAIKFNINGIHDVRSVVDKIRNNTCVEYYSSIHYKLKFHKFHTVYHLL